MRLILALLLVASPALAQTDAEAGFDSGDIAPGASWSMTFEDVNEAGYAYHCHPHPWMEGMVHVRPDADGVDETWYVDIVEGDDAESWGYSTEHLLIEAGDTVVWNNTGAVVHTVTQVAGAHEHDHDEHDDVHNEDSPGPAWLGVLAGVATVLLLRRR